MGDGVGYLRGVNDVFLEQIRSADQKATYILTLIILMLVWSPELRGLVFPTSARSRDGFAAAAQLFSTVSLLIALISALAVVLPRGRRDGGEALYWGAWPEARETAVELASRGDEAALIASYARNAEHLAAICRRKYRFVSAAIWALIFAVVSHGMAVVIG